MPMVCFSSEFPEVALNEMRRIISKKRNDIPDGEYLLLDSYCDEPDCDCRRAMINVVSSEAPRDILATINYGWEDIEFYKEFLLGGEKEAEYAAGAALDQLNFQSDLAPAFLKVFRETLTSSYIDTLKEHYKKFKQAVKAKRIISNEAKSRYGRKIGRNDPCPCGSNKKYKKCCGKEA